MEMRVIKVEIATLFVSVKYNQLHTRLFELVDVAQLVRAGDL